MQSRPRVEPVTRNNDRHNEKQKTPMSRFHSSLGSKAFGKDANPRLIVAYESHQEAMRFLSSSLEQPNGIALLQGPTGSGKSTIVREQAAWLERDASVAIVAGAHLTPRGLLTGMLNQFGIDSDTDQEDLLLQIVNDFASRQAARGAPPVLIIDDADRAMPSALRLVNWLAALEVRDLFSLRIVLTGKERLSKLAHDDSLRRLAHRQPLVYSLNPLTPQETQIYLHTRLIAAGGSRCERVFPIDVCSQLRESSRGWPGLLNERALEVMDRMKELRAARPVPRVIVSRDGEPVAEYELDSKRQYVIGRTGLAYIVIEDSYVSKLHAMLKVYNNAVALFDLNSTNGTTVNSREVEKTILRNDDVISLGRHRLKVENIPPVTAQMAEQIKAADTVVLKDLEDIRRSRARRTIAALKHR
jgi:type II secretory pathway predicted ATPase ExeA